MPLKLEDKRAIVAAVNEIANRAHSAIVAEYRGITCAEMTQLRQGARGAGVYLRVVRNTLARRAVKNTDFECLSEILVGPVALAFSIDDPGAAARVMSEYAKTHDKLIVKGVSISGRLLLASEIDFVAKLPTHTEAISMLMSVIQAPISKLVRTLAEPHAKLVRTLAAVHDSKPNQ
ncbi:MAG: 50S ribosomal protein L10 [Candidatus Parabeggiatoa sp. nov. 2]|nr:MAG: 50S ribosomal protein L10 [Beggiatoa sp. 4572_84]RKZ61960.1 MAG: 50S ribosomal protein L10 [Gammaproteobacteria bacterium]HEC86139.1 50S ribosomal protein L10 [Thioploca sp.]